MTNKLVLFFLAFSFFGCTGKTAIVLEDGGSHNSDLPDPTNGLTPASCGDTNVTTLQGTWDLLLSRAGGAPTSATLTIDPNTFSFATSSQSLTFTVNGSALNLVWQNDGRQSPITATHGNAPVDVGLVPLALGGTWNFSSSTGEQRCTASLATTDFNASCNEVATPVSGLGNLKNTIVGHRTQAATSIFGELGGAWHLTGDHESSADVVFSGSSFEATVVSGNGRTASVSVRVCAKSASGVTSDGFEIAGTRR